MNTCTCKHKQQKILNYVRGWKTKRNQTHLLVLYFVNVRMCDISISFWILILVPGPLKSLLNDRLDIISRFERFKSKNMKWRKFKTCH